MRDTSSKRLALLFFPARKLMDRLTYIHKFFLISALFLLPVFLLGYGLVVEIQRNLAVNKVEQQGLLMLSGAFGLIEEASEYRDRSIVLRVNDMDVIRTQLEAQREKVESMLQSLQEAVEAFDDEEVDHQFKQVRVSWKQLNSYSSGTQGGPHIQFKYFDSFVRSVQVLVDVIGYRAKLVHDPDLNTFLLINMLSDDMPIALRELGRARAYGVYALSQMSVDHETYKQLDEIYDDLTDSFHLLSNNLGYAVAENEQFHLPLQKGVDQVISGIIKGRDLMYREIIEADRRVLLWQDYYQRMSLIHDEFYQFTDQLLSIVGEQLKGKADKEKDKLLAFSIMTCILLIIIIYLFSGMYLSVHQTIRDFVLHSKSVAQGNLTDFMPENTHDEMRDLAINFNQMVSQLAENQRELVEARKAVGMGRLVAGIAHEINTPIGVSITSVSFLEDQLKQAEQDYKEGKLSSKGFESMLSMGAESLALVHRNLDKSANLVKYFKMLSVSPKPETWMQFQIPDVFNKVLEGLDNKQRAQLCEVSWQGVTSVYGDQARLVKLLLILVNNAFEHAYKHQPLGKVFLSSEIVEDQLRLVIEDHGVGISAELRAHMFDPFVSSESGAQSTGLGLNIAHNIVTQALYGKIQCESEEGLFTRFIVTVPTDFRDNV